MSTHHNPVTARDFGKANAATLEQAFKAGGYRARQWATFQQWKNAGRAVIKGERGCELTMARGWKFRVFNFDQTMASEAPAPQVDAVAHAAPIAAAPTISALLASVIDATPATATAAPAPLEPVALATPEADDTAGRAKRNGVPLNIQQSADVAASKWGARAGADFIRRYKARQTEIEREERKPGAYYVISDAQLRRDLKGRTHDDVRRETAAAINARLAKPMGAAPAKDAGFGTSIGNPDLSYAEWKEARTAAPSRKPKSPMKVMADAVTDFRQAFAAAAAARIAAE